MEHAGYMTSGQIRKEFGISERALRAAIKKGELPFELKTFRGGVTYRTKVCHILRADIEAWLERVPGIAREEMATEEWWTVDETHRYTRVPMKLIVQAIKEGKIHTKVLLKRQPAIDGRHSRARHLRVKEVEQLWRA